jgi:hypothetical protein
MMLRDRGSLLIPRLAQLSPQLLDRADAIVVYPGYRHFGRGETSDRLQPAKVLSTRPMISYVMPCSRNLPFERTRGMRFAAKM